MTVFLIILACIVWAGIGVWSIIWWWTNDFDFAWEDLMLIPSGVLLGVNAFIFFVCPILLNGRGRKVILRKRK